MKTAAAVFALAAVLFLWALGSHDVWAPDEPYFAEGAREMVVDGEWAVPHVNGKVTTDKPPLFFWLIAVLSLPLGAVTPWTARLPSALAALGTLALVLRLGRRFADERTAWLAGVVLCTLYMFWEKARWSQIDSLLCFLIWVALSAFEAWRAGDADGRRAGLLFWLAASLAVLAKGPVGFLLPLGIAVATLASDRDLRSFKRFAPVSGPALFAAVVGAWMVLATVGGGGEYSVWGALEEHFIGRGIHGMHHRQPPWYYLQVLPILLLPWTGLVPGALVLAARRRHASDRFLVVVVLFVVTFFSISTEKRELYALPAYPAFALLVAGLIGAVTSPRSETVHRAPGVGRRWILVGQAVVGGVLMLAGGLLPVLARGRDEAPYGLALALALILLVGGVVTLVMCWRQLPLPASLAPAATFAVLYLFTVSFVYPALEGSKSSRSFATRMKVSTETSRRAGEPVVALGLDNLPEAFAFHTEGLYTVEIEDVASLAEHLRKPTHVWAVVNAARIDALPEEVRASIHVVETARLSRRDVVLLTNRQPAAEPRTEGRE